MKMNEVKKHKVFIVDDHELVRKGLREMVSSAPDLEMCGDAACVADVSKLKNRIQPDVSIVDISLPDGNGLELVKRLHLWRPEMKIVVLSMHDDELFAERALQYGALAYINKQDSAEKLLTGIREVLKNKFYFSSDVTDRMLHRMSKKSVNNDPSPIAQLSNRELEVFESIGRGKSTKAIAHDLKLSIKTIESHRSNIKKKLNLKSGADLTRRAILWFVESH